LLRVAVIDYEAGNLRSVARALSAVGAEPVLTKSPREVLAADAAVLPGQGRCDQAMDSLRNLGMMDAIHRLVREDRPFFGVCVGLQLLLDMSEEGNATCLGIVPGRVRKLPLGLKVPHMGWNDVNIKTSHVFFAGVPQGSYFYFVHSYYPDVANKADIAATTTYGVEFGCAVSRGNLVATQFHPEKSGAVGLKLYANFVKLASEVSAAR
jgi:glutamine amidotransferase